MSYLRSKLQAPSRNICGSVLRWLAASAACLSIHFLPSARQSAASVGSALTPSPRKTLSSTVLFLIVASGLGSSADAVWLKPMQSISASGPKKKRSLLEKLVCAENMPIIYLLDARMFV